MIVIIDYGIGNLLAIFPICCSAWDLKTNIARLDMIGQAKGLILPGNGHYDACLKAFTRARYPAGNKTWRVRKKCADFGDMCWRTNVGSHKRRGLLIIWVLAGLIWMWSNSPPTVT